MRKITLAGLVAAAALLNGCGPQQQYVYTKLDNTPVVDQVKFGDDKTICLAEMNKADVSGTVVSSNNVFIDADNRVARAGRLDKIMEACMLVKGYRLKAVTIEASVR
jgi:hypothetical protein